MTEETPDWDAAVTALEAVLDRLTEYSGKTGRLGLHDLALLETLQENPESLSTTPHESMVRFLDHGETVFIGGPKGYAWESWDEDVREAAVRLGVGKAEDAEDEDEGEFL